MRCLGIDPGSVRVGLAVSDPDGRVATPLQVVDAAPAPRLAAVLAPIIDEYGIGRLVVGLPRRTDGSSGPEARRAREFGVALGEACGLPVAFADERFSTRIAHQAGIAAGRNAKQRRDKVDAVAASVLLQTWLDAESAKAARRAAASGAVTPTAAEEA